MSTKSSYDRLSDLKLVDAGESAKSWDRRRRGEARANAVVLLDRAATHLIEDQMSEGRVYCAGAVEAVRLLRESMVAIEADERMYQRAGRAVACWLPKHVLARQMRDGVSDA